ncbi:MAG: hypothetical protein QOI49_2090 [Verrucomicrobiota bacterium]
MTLWTKWQPLSTRAGAASKLNALSKAHFFLQCFCESLQLFFCLCVIKALTLQLRAKASFLRLQNRYFSFGLFQAIHRKRKTLAKDFRYRNILQGIPGRFDHPHGGYYMTAPDLHESDCPQRVLNLNVGL